MPLAGGASGAGASATTGSLLSSTTASNGHLSSGEKSSPEYKVSNQHMCSLCKSTFKDFEEQRKHVRSTWHIHNLQRKMEGLTPVDEVDFQSQHRSKPGQQRQGTRNQKDEGDEVFMRRYLVSKRNDWSSSSSNSASGVECSECEDEWDTLSSSEEAMEEGSEDDAETHDPSRTFHIEHGELRLENGKVLGVKTHRSRRKSQHQSFSQPLNSQELSHRPSHASSQLLTQQYLSNNSSAAPVMPHSDRILARRDVMAIVGLDDRERQALMATERKMVKLEMRVRGDFARLVDKKGNCQKHYRIGGSRGGKKMGGLEKRLG